MPGGDGCRAVVSLFADDLTVILTQAEEFQRARAHLDSYCQATGAAVNAAKSRVMTCGSWSGGAEHSGQVSSLCVWTEDLGYPFLPAGQRCQELGPLPEKSAAEVSTMGYEEAVHQGPGHGGKVGHSVQTGSYGLGFPSPPSRRTQDGKADLLLPLVRGQGTGC